MKSNGDLKAEGGKTGRSLFRTKKTVKKAGKILRDQQAAVKKTAKKAGKKLRDQEGAAKKATARIVSSAWQAGKRLKKLRGFNPLLLPAAAGFFLAVILVITTVTTVVFVLVQGGIGLSAATAERENAKQLLSAAYSRALSPAQALTSRVRDRFEEELRAQYRDILDRGQGDEFEPFPEGQKKLWEEVRKQRREELQADPLLLLVNKWHYQPDGYEVETVELANGQSISADCYEPLTRMLEDCAAAGGTPIVCSGYRPHWHQVGLFDEQIRGWLNEGYGQEEAEALAATAVAIPGTSEHELGLAADIYSSENMSLDESQIYTFTQQWLMENCWHYGFILRYPQNRSGITGIIFEPWHYRYVGMEHAEKIMKAGICLEEYLDAADH